MSFYVDADDQRQKARWAEQQLLAHDQRRPPRPRLRDPADDEPESLLPPVFRKEGYYAASRDTSVERRASRFRDGLPPPPLLTPEMDPTAIPRLLPPSLPALVPPDQFGTTPGYLMYPDTNPPEPEDLPLPPRAEPQYRMTSQGLVPVGPLLPQASPPRLGLPPEVQQALVVSDEAAPLTTLTPSQKKRLRRKRKREGPSPAPFPLALDQPAAISANGPASQFPASAVFPTHPEATQTTCQAECLVRMPNGSTHRLVCPLRPFPHPNQPHMIQLPSAQDDGAEIFIGFWMPGE